MDCQEKLVKINGFQFQFSCSNDTAFSSTGTCVLSRGGAFDSYASTGLFYIACHISTNAPYVMYGFRNNDTAYSASGIYTLSRGGYFANNVSDGLFAHNTSAIQTYSNDNYGLAMIQLGVLQELGVCIVVVLVVDIIVDIGHGI